MHLENLESLHASITEVSWRRLIQFLESVKMGQDTDYVTPFLPKEWRSDQLSYAAKLLNQLALTDFDLLNEIEERESEKFGPFSLRAPWEVRKPGVLEYFSQKQVEVDESLEYGYRQVVSLLPKASLIPLTLEASFKASPHGKNLGLPDFTSDRRFEPNYMSRAVSIARGGYKEGVYPSIIGWRGQPNGSTKLIKNRVTWMFDHVETYIGTGVIQVALNALRTKPGFAAWNDLGTVDRRVTSIIDRARYPIMSVDFSGYDKSLPSSVIRLAFSVLRYWFNRGAQRQIDWMEDQFLHTGLVTPDGIYTGRDGGVPSGSSATNFIDSLAQMILAHSADRDLNLGLQDIEVLGDDGVLSFSREVDVDAITKYYLDKFGMVVSSDKGGFSVDSVQFLQRLHYRKSRVNGLCHGMRSLIRTLNGVCHLEHLSKGLPPEFFSCRCIMQVENARWHPRFRDLVKHVFSIDNFMQRDDPKVLFMKAGGVKAVESSLGLRSFKFGSELPSKGLDDFATVKELRRLRSGKGKRVA